MCSASPVKCFWPENKVLHGHNYIIKHLASSFKTWLAVCVPSVVELSTVA